MQSEFKISEISKVTGGDYVSFVIVEHGGSRPAKISRTAIKILAAADTYDETRVIRDNAEKIRDAADRWRKANPGALVVDLKDDCF